MKIKPEPPTEEEIHTNLEDGVLQTKAFMYRMLALFLSGQALVSYLIASLLLIILSLVITYIFVIGGNETELIKLILNNKFPNLFPP